MAETGLPMAQDQALSGVNVGGANSGFGLGELLRQPAIRRSIPALIGFGAIALVGMLYLTIAQGPQRVLYGNLTDGERAKVVETLDQGSIDYNIDSGTGMLTVSEEDVYRARMLVASDAGLAAPQSATDMLDSIPMGSSRTLEGERLRLARERELTLTIQEIDGIETVRVHLATPERSVFVRESSPPSASVMVRLAGGRSLTQDQVEAIVNLVSGSIPGLDADAVRVVDQNGRLLSSEKEGNLDGLVLQREFESKLREQINALLLPLLGDGNFSSQVQVELEQSEVTSARESYEPEGALRSESERNSTRNSGAATGAGGIPGVLANTPPPPTEVLEGAPDPQGGEQVAAATQTTAAADTETSASRAYELDREVAVTNTRAGALVKLSVAVAVSEEALTAADPLTAEEIQSLVGAAVGATEDRGDLVTVVVSKFETAEFVEPAFYEEQWFANVMRYVAALLTVLLVLMLAVRPLIKKLRSGGDTSGAAAGSSDEDDGLIADGNAGDGTTGEMQPAANGDPSMGDLPEQVELARRLAVAQPERAVATLQRMLQAPTQAGTP
ncbi:MAG: flagellar basal-body MS-ring/collar protein FliF [Erythrobacter sp.]